jgi:hypothetical protein
MMSAPLIMVLLLGVGPVASGPEPTPAAAVARGIQLLKQEVKKDATHPPRDEADFFDDFEFETDATEAAKRLTTPLDAKPRVDAYIRWQLTAIADPNRLPTARRYRQMLDRMPRLPPNPLADERTIRRFEREAYRTYQTKETAQAAITAYQAVEQQSEQAEDWAMPGRQLRLWLVDRSVDPQAKLLAMLEWVHAEVAAGWNPRQAINRMDGLCKRLGDAGALDEEAIDAFKASANRLTSTRSPLAVNAWAQEKSFSVEVTYITLEDYDINRWVKRLRYGAPPE